MIQLGKRMMAFAVAAVCALGLVQGPAPALAAETAPVQVPAADAFDVDFADGTATDASAAQNKLGKTVGAPEIAQSDEVHKQVASFDGSSAYLYPFAKNYAGFSTTATVEAMVKFDEVPGSGERDFFSNQQSGGLGLGFGGGKLTFYANVNGAYREPTATVKPNTWYHVVGVVDGSQVKLYVNGKLESTVDAGGEGIRFTSNANAQNMVLGGDSSSSGGAESLFKGTLSFARMYTAALSDAQVSTLNGRAFDGVTVEPLEPQAVKLGLIGSATIGKNGDWNLNVHADQDKAGSIDRIAFDLAYDPVKLVYRDDQETMRGVTVTKTDEGTLHVDSTAPLSSEGFYQFGSTRLDKLDFAVAQGASGDTTVEVKNFKAYAGNQDVTEQLKEMPTAKKDVTLQAGDPFDFNGDGVIGAGDVALAPADQKAAVAKRAAIYPYKHVIILTMDGGGQVWNPDAIYYDAGDGDPQKTSDPAIMAKRTNTYAVDLMNNRFATSYTASSVNPPISAQNYSSMLHGIPWGDVEGDYQVTNSIAGQHYYADFNQEQAKYPSLFKAVTAATPGRTNAAFAEWTPILNGIIEPDAQVYGCKSASKQSFYDVANYIKSAKFQNTGVVYMQSDYMDGVGHGSGYFNDNYYAELQQYDDFYKAVMDALEESGHADDTLVISNSDHGGHQTTHGDYSRSSDRDIFIALGGLTVDAGKRLNGGDNSDIAPLALAALRASQPGSMTGKVFDQSAFLPQDQMVKKNRDVAKLTLVNDAAKSGKAVLRLSNGKGAVRVVDAVIDLAADANAQVKPAEGVQVVRQERTGTELKLTLSLDEAKAADKDRALAVIDTGFQTGDAAATLREVMVGDAEGNEVYPDIATTSGKIDADGSAGNGGQNGNQGGNQGGANQDGGQNGQGGVNGQGGTPAGQVTAPVASGKVPNGSAPGRLPQTGDGFPVAIVAVLAVAAVAAIGAGWALHRRSR